MIDFFKKKVWRFTVLLSLLITYNLSLTTVSAQKVTGPDKKKIVADFRPKLSQFMPFGTSATCSLKSKGDANCDDLVNQFDLSVWEVEFNATNSPRRSDFNNDGIVNLLDFGIWKGTFYPQKATAFSSLIKKIAGMVHFSVEAQTQATENQLSSSQAVVSSTGDSLVINNNQNNTSQQVNFDSNGNPQSSDVFNETGEFLTGVAFLNTGTTVVTTEEDGIAVQITRTVEGPVFQFFRNPDGTLIASKSWPTAADYDSGQPPLSVSLPGAKPGEIITLSIQPNGGGTMTEIDKNGEVTRQTQISGNGLETRYDTSSNSTLQSFDKYGVAVQILSMANSIGGTTAYYFSDNELFTIVQTDNKSNTWFATLTTDDKWEMLNTREAQGGKKIVDDPIKEVNSNTPNPNQLIQTWNTVLAAAKNNLPEIDFSTGFNSNSDLLASQVQEANYAYAVNRVPAPNVLGIIKEVHAEQGRVISDTKTPEGPGTTTVVQVTVYEGDLGGVPNQVVQVTVYDLTTGTRTDAGSVLPPGTDLSSIDASGKTPGQALADVKTALGPSGDTAAIGQPAPVSSLTVPNQPAPAQPAPNQPAPAQPAPNQPAPAQPAPAQPAAGGGYTPPGWSPAPGTNRQNNDPKDYAGFKSTSTLTTKGEGPGQGNTVITTTYRNGVQTSEFKPDGTAVSTNFNITSGPLSGASMNINPATQAVTSIDNVPGVGTVDLTTGATNPGIAGKQDTIDAINASLREQAAANGQESFNGLNSDGTVTRCPTASATGACFLAGTLISTPDGPKAIETLKQGDKVYSYNEKTEKKQVSGFKELDLKSVDEYLIINGKIHTTIYHPFYRVNDRALLTIRADRLKIGDILLGEDGDHIPVSSIKRISSPDTIVYNLVEVSQNNNFFAEGILVHNYGADPADFNTVSVEMTEPSDPESADNPYGEGGYEAYGEGGYEAYGQGGYDAYGQGGYDTE